MNRQEFLSYVLWGAGGSVAAGGIGAVVYQALFVDPRRRAQEAERLKSETAVFEVEIEKQGTSAMIQRYTRSQDLFSAMGATLYDTGDYETYWNTFSSDLQSAGPGYGHHTPKFWENFVDIAGGRIWPTGETVVQLSNRLNQWAAHFGEQGDPKQRTARLQQLLMLHFREMAGPIDNAQLLYDLEQKKLERDIGRLILTTRQLIGTDTEALGTKADAAVDQWLNNSSVVLAQTTSFSPDQISGAARLANPFI